jgi:ribulose 1,5-bisphosphate carboxylase large subunit-like protein
MEIKMQKYVPIEIRDREILETIEFDSQHDPEESILFVYYIKTNSDLVETAKKIAEEETTGKWIGTGTPTAIFNSARADVCKIEKYGDGEGVIYVRSPLHNIDLESDLFYQIAMLSVGGPILEFVYYQQVAYLDFELPEKALRRFPGPKFGIKGSREFIGLNDDQPLMGTIIKPCCGLTPEESAEKAYQAALGGVVLMKDDEKMMNPEYCPFEKKVRLISEGLKKAQDETGKRVIYAPHLTARPDKIRDMALRAIEYGATGVMFNAILANNLGTVEILASDPDINVPIYVHSGGRSALSTGPRRIDEVVTAKLTRLCGGDYFQIGVMGQFNVHVASLDPPMLIRLNEIFQQPMSGIKDTVSVTAGGLGAANLGKNIEAFGYDFAPLAGSNVLDHPMGPKSGAIAMEQALIAFREEKITDPKVLKDYAVKKGYKELLAVL